MLLLAAYVAAHLVNVSPAERKSMPSGSRQFRGLATALTARSASSRVRWKRAEHKPKIADKAARFWRPLFAFGAGASFLFWRRGRRGVLSALLLPQLVQNIENLLFGRLLLLVLLVLLVVLLPLFLSRLQLLAFSTPSW